MALTAGDKLGPYEVLAQLGEPEAVPGVVSLAQNFGSLAR